MTLIPEMGNTTDASMMDGPPPMARTQSRLAPSGFGLRVSSQENSDGDESGNNGGEKGKNLSPGQNSAITGIHSHA